MIEFTRERQLANIELAERLWRERVTPDKVLPGLTAWVSDPHPNTCGTQACFGGHLAGWHEFRELGVRRLREFASSAQARSCADAPALDPNNWGWEVAQALFADGNLFEPRGNHPADPEYRGYDDDESISDHELVLNRLGYARRYLEEVAP